MTTVRLLLTSVAAALGLTAAGALAWGLFTTSGSVALVRLALRATSDVRQLSAGRAEGTLVRGLRLSEVEVRGLPRLPSGSALKLDTLRLAPAFPRLRASVVEVRNGRLTIPFLEYPLVLSGRASSEGVDAAVYAKSVDLEALAARLAAPAALRGISGVVTDLDAVVQGPWRTLAVGGTFHADRVSYRDFTFGQSPVSFHVTLTQSSRGVQADGHAVFMGGTVSARNTTIILGASRLTFATAPPTVSLDIHGTTVIEGVSIRLTLKGSLDRPDLRLASDPPLSQENLLLMLATGQRWRGLEGVPAEGQVPLDLARDFVDYVLFSGPATRVIQHFGMRGLSLAYDPATRGLTVTKSVSDRTELRYGIEQTAPQDGPVPATTHTMGAEVKITPQVSVEAEGEVTPLGQPAQPGQQETTRRDGKVLLKYKKRF